MPSSDAQQDPQSDAELVAIAACLAVLRPLPEAARMRALAYITERLASESTTNGAAAT